MDPKGEADTVLVKSRRDPLVARHREARAAYNQAMDEHAAQLEDPVEIGIDPSSSAFVDTPAYRRARAALSDMVTIEVEYFRVLPRLALACCPHCEKPFFRAFDPFGIDGLWWRTDAHPTEPAACPHFCLLQGAVDLRGGHASPDFDVNPGPGAPFVIPRLLEQPGMLAVISRIAMVDGALAYPIAYFAARRPPMQTLAASWARTNFVYTTQLGVRAWRNADDSAGGAGHDTWDFALEPWIARGKIRWCDPAGDGTILSTAGAFPFAKATGIQRAQVIAQSEPVYRL